MVRAGNFGRCGGTRCRVEEWQSFTNQLSGGFVIQSSDTKLEPKAQEWEMLYAVPTQP